MLAVEADLRVQSGGLCIRVAGSGNVLTCRLDGDPANLFQTLSRSRRLVAAIRALTPLLERTGLRVDLIVGNVRLGSFGTGVKQNAAARMLGLRSVRLGP